VKLSRTAASSQLFWNLHRQELDSPPTFVTSVCYQPFAVRSHFGLCRYQKFCDLLALRLHQLTRSLFQNVTSTVVRSLYASPIPFWMFTSVTSGAWFVLKTRSSNLTRQERHRTEHRLQERNHWNPVTFGYNRTRVVKTVIVASS
jgi:hypothetical protein